ncbi:GRB2-related adapter protein-like isoform X3 [Centropristis striata]|uniref:GRB2-related adapter protein-like isoform X3 n=1 Tax=Centropristis striata TaxID=184440 RepID=UPI0027DEC217|nr:GRB2-related adapter protein-like isoform X3 [Centropristis striata]
MEALALFSFTASEADEISFKKGDLIKVTEMEDDSCWVTAEIQGRRGYVPENYISLLPYSWFAGPVSRLEAEKRLRWQDTGVFLVRESESAPGEFSVSVSYGDRVEHFRVLEGGGQYCIWDESFCSLNRLVDFYRTHSIAVEKVVCLRDPPESLQKPRLAHALCDYTPPHTAHLHFLRGDIIDLLDCSSSLTWRGRCRGRVGIFPPEYVQPLYH